MPDDEKPYVNPPCMGGEPYPIIFEHCSEGPTVEINRENVPEKFKKQFTQLLDELNKEKTKLEKLKSEK